MKFLELLKKTAPYQNSYLFESINNKLIHYYNISDRKYHDITHINQCIDEFNNMPKFLYSKDDLTKILYALYYHDYFYDPKGNMNNEMISAQVAYVDLIALGFDYNFATDMQNLILCTKHNKISDKLIEQTVMDIDLAILGKEISIFFNFEADIRSEFYFVPKQEYITGRSNILNKFLDREYIYQALYFRDLYEKKARENIQLLLKVLNPSD